MYKYIVKNVARKHGKTATFMPKPIFGDNGSGMHTHQSLWKTGSRCSTTRTATPGCRDLGRCTSAACSSTPRPCWPSPPRPPTPTAAWCPATRPRSTWSTPSATARPRSASRSTRSSPKAKRIEFRCPDPSCNPYLAFAAMLMAGLDGVQNKIEPPAPLDKDLYDLQPEELAEIPQDARLARRGARRARGRPRLPARGRRLHPGPDRHLDRLQARARGRRRSACARTRTSSTSTTTSRSPRAVGRRSDAVSSSVRPAAFGESRRRWCESSVLTKPVRLASVCLGMVCASRSAGTRSVRPPN